MSRPLRLTAILAALNGDATAVSPSLAQVKTALSASLTPTALGARFQTPEVKPEVKRDVSEAPLIPLNVAPGFTSASPVTQTDFRVAAGVQAPAISGHVLLVDDSDVALKFMNNRLKHFGYDCQLARSGEEALAMVASHDFQFVFLDVMMTGLDGYQTCRAIKQNKARRGPAPVVVMLTSKGGTIDKIRGSMAGCDGYLTKPLNERHLASVLAKFDDSTVAERFAASNLPQPVVSTLKPRARLL